MQKPYKARFKTGEWTPVAIAGESIDGRVLPVSILENMVKNYKPKVNGFKAKIKIGHTNNLLPEGKAYGYFSEVRMSPENPLIMEGKPEWVHEELIEKLEKGEYRDISPEIRAIPKHTGQFDALGNPIFAPEYYFFGVAVLGESQPAFPILSIDFSSERLPVEMPIQDIFYKSNLIEIEQLFQPNTNTLIEKVDNKNKLENEYGTLQQNYSLELKEKQQLIDYYSRLLAETRAELDSYKTNTQRKQIIEFCEQSLREGKLEPYELMKKQPTDTIAESGLVEHFLSLSPEQLGFEMELIQSREVNKRFKPITNIDSRKTQTIDFGDYTDFEEKKFIDFCKEHNYNLKDVCDIDKAYDEWRNNVNK